MATFLPKYIAVAFIISLLTNGIHSRHNELKNIPIIYTSGRHYKVMEPVSNPEEDDEYDEYEEHILQSPKYSIDDDDDYDDDDNISIDIDDFEFMIHQIANMNHSRKNELCLRHIKYACIILSGFTITTEIEINGKYCVYQCNEKDPLYPEYIQQETCGYYIKWTTDNSYMIYSYLNRENKSNDNIIYASSKDCDPNKIALSNMQSCSYWETFYDGIEEASINIHPYQGVDISANICTDTPVLFGLDTGEIACIIIFLILIFLCVFGGAINYFEFW